MVEFGGDVNSTGVWKYAIIGGLVSIPFTAASYLQTGRRVSLTAVLVGGFLAGYLAEKRTKTTRGVGLRAGLVSGIPLLWMGFDALQTISNISNPEWFSAALVGLSVLIIGLGFFLAALGGEIGAWIGIWLAKRDGVHLLRNTDGQ